MYESVVVPFNNTYGDEIETSSGQKKIIFHNASQDHITITAIDPEKNDCIEVTIRKKNLPKFITNPRLIDRID